jgi:glycerol-3-phosphate dehydrogenase
VNATGPWVDELRSINKSKQGKELHLTKGVHIVVPYHRLPVRQAIYFDVPDGRMIFAIPRGRITYIGTTDTDYQGDKNHVVTSREDAQYLLYAVNETFPAALLTFADIESSWAGLRPLIHEEGKSASELSRKDEIFESSSGLISIAGGKLTGYRKMAERVVDKVIDRDFSDRDLGDCKTKELILPGGDFKEFADVKKLELELVSRLDALNLQGNEATNLVHLFGRQALLILDQVEKNRTEHPECDLILAKAWFSIQYEMAIVPLDFINRRSGLLYFNHPKILRWVQPVIDYFADEFNWSETEKKNQQAEVHQALKEIINF